MDDEEIIRADFQHLAASLLQNEELGEKRVNAFVTLGAAFFAVVGYVGSNREAVPGVTFHGAMAFVSAILLAIGFLTLLRIRRRNAATDSYIAALNAIRRLRAGKASAEYLRPLRQPGPRSIWNGGHAYVVIVMNTGLSAVFFWASSKGAASSLELASFGMLFALVQYALAQDMRAGDPHESMRVSVGILVMDASGKVLAIERTAVPGAWQLPQGGLKAGEKPLDAALRELEEETGLGRADVELSSEYPQWLAYELPRKYRSNKTGLGQVQRWFLFRYLRTDPNVLPPKNGEARRCAFWNLEHLAAITVEFRRPVYLALASWLKERAAEDTTTS